MDQTVQRTDTSHTNAAMDGADGFHKQPVSMEACVAAVLSAVNRHFGSNFGRRNIVGKPFQRGGATNVDFSTAELPDGCFLSFQPGRYPLSFLTWLTGCGPTLHITSTGSDGAIDENRQALREQHMRAEPGRDGLTLFRAHIDSAYAYHPAGFVAHLLVDVLYFGKIRARLARRRSGSLDLLLRHN